MNPERPQRPQRSDIFVPPRRPVQMMQPEPLKQPSNPQPINNQREYREPPFDNRHHGNGWLKAFFILLTLILIGAAAYGGYYYATHYKNKQQASQSIVSQSSNSDNSTLATDNEESAKDDSLHYVSASGSPFDLGGKKTFTVALGLPGIAQGIRAQSYNNDRGQEQYYTDRYANEIARWDIGYPDLVQSTQSQVSVLAISKSWLALKQSGNHAFDNTETALDTPAQKKAYISKISSEADSCVKDKSKGFTTKDNVFKVCFSLIPGAKQYTPVLVLRGYGEAEGQPLLLVGFVHLEDGRKYDDAKAKQVLADAEKGKLPDSTTGMINTFITAFSQTTFKVQ